MIFYAPTENKIIPIVNFVPFESAEKGCKKKLYSTSFPDN